MTEQEKADQRFLAEDDGLIISGNDYVPDWDAVLAEVENE